MVQDKGKPPLVGLSLKNGLTLKHMKSLLMAINLERKDEVLNNLEWNLLRIVLNE